ncbi:Uncharacterised protein [Enterobacter hormaechei]|nr:Uncharacterised protein [Enterobacter hormaechei]
MDKIKRKVIIFVVLFALGFGVCQYFRPYDPSPQTLTSSQQVAMNKINAEMKPYCAGRYMLDLPGNDSNLLIVFYVQIMPDDLVMQLHRF